ncbi:MAG: TetR/AcrR family transcriptional regulator [Ardenticatenaceae bacterium]
MASRNEHEYENRRQQIMDAALKVFARKGFEKATNKEIAKAAGIKSPGLIYHYFQNKRDLFQKAIEEKSSTLQLLFQSDALMDLPPRETLTRLGTHFIEMASDKNFMLLYRAILGEAIKRPQLAQMLNQVGPSRVINFLRRYLSHQMEIGNLRPMDPSIAARCFLGPILAYLLTRNIFQQADIQEVSGEEMLATAVEIFLQGMEVKE